MRRALLPVGALVAAALALAAALLATDVRHWHDALDRASTVLAAGGIPGGDVLDPSTSMPFHAAERILGTADDVEAVRALALFRATRRGTAIGFEQITARGEAEAALARVAGERGNPARASQALTLLGVLAYEDSIPRPGRLAAPPERALADFQTAVRLDPGNATAKTNLELLLRILEVRGARPGQGQGGAENGGAGEGGASVNAPGGGY